MWFHTSSRRPKWLDEARENILSFFEHPLQDSILLSCPEDRLESRILGIVLGRMVSLVMQPVGGFGRRRVMGYMVVSMSIEGVCKNKFSDFLGNGEIQFSKRDRCRLQ